VTSGSTVVNLIDHEFGNRASKTLNGVACVFDRAQPALSFIISLGSELPVNPQPRHKSKNILSQSR